MFLFEHEDLGALQLFFHYDGFLLQQGGFFLRLFRRKASDHATLRVFRRNTGKKMTPQTRHT